MKNKTTYCLKCVMPNNSVALSLNKKGICSACEYHEVYQSISSDEWKERRKKFEDILKLHKSNSNYDCIIPVSGGKDSYYQTHQIVKEFNLKPLLVTYDGNNYLPEGIHNRDKMREVFDADHLVFGPSVKTLIKLNRQCFKIMGDMNWHAHCGISTYPFQIAAKFNIPLTIWGETFWDISGMYDVSDMVEFTNRMRNEHNLRGYEWEDVIKNSDLREQDMLWAKFPSDEEYLQNKIRGIPVGNYFKWNPNNHTRMIMEKYNWKQKKIPFERTYRQMSNLDDRYENGVHDLLKFIKFGYGRGSDHASKDIRTNYMSREQGIAMVKKYDHIIPQDLDFWLNYVQMKEDEFWKIADTFRSEKVWWIKNNEWYKNNIWGESSPYGEVRLNKDLQEKYKLS
jgi:N-acetyl sugar amidotransferase